MQFHQRLNQSKYFYKNQEYLPLNLTLLGIETNQYEIMVYSYHFRMKIKESFYNCNQFKKQFLIFTTN